MSLSELHEGIPVPEHAGHIPWLITRDELGQYVPLSAFTMSLAHWPQLRFTLLGVNTTFSFNFVTHPDARLVGVEFSNSDDGKVETAFRAISTVLREHLGKPRGIDDPEQFNEIWRDDHVSIHHLADLSDEAEAVRTHRLSLFYHAGMPRVWITDGEPTLAQVRQLFDLLPGVKVTELLRPPGCIIFGLTIESLPALSRLVCVTGAANVPLQVEVDEYQKANRELGNADPNGLIYRVKVDTPCVPDLNEQLRTLRILGNNLIEDLRDQKILNGADVHRYTMILNDLEV